MRSNHNRSSPKKNTDRVEWKELRDDLLKRLEDPDFRRRGVERLAQAMARLDKGEASISCAACEEMLDIYLDADLAGEDVQQLYPAIWHHLQSCTACRADYLLLRESLEESRSGQLPIPAQAARPQLSFLQEDAVLPALPSVFEPPWHVHTVPKLMEGFYRLSLHISAYYLNGFRSQPELSPTRGENDISDLGLRPRLLLSQSAMLGELEILLEVHVVPIVGQPDRMRLKATLAASQALPPGTQARLRWGDDLRVCTVDEYGEVDFGEVSFAVVQQQIQALRTDSDNFRISFEIPQTG